MDGRTRVKGRIRLESAAESRVKILVLNYEYPPIGGGGGRACADLCQALAYCGHELRLITSHAQGLPRDEMIDGYRVLRVPSGRRVLTQASLRVMLGYLLGAFFPALSHLRRWKPDLIHVHFAVPTGVLGYVLSRLSGIPYVLTAHLGDVPGGVPEKTDRWFRFIYPFTPPIWKGARAVVTVSGYTMELAQKHYPVAMSVIPNGVKLPENSEIDKNLTVGDTPRLIFAGRFQPQKNLVFLVESLSGLKDLKWTCILLGDGPQREAIETAIKKTHLEDRIHLGGWVSTDEVWRQLGESDILVMPSLSEGLPVVGVHALAQGLVIVANRAGGLIDLVEDGVNGRLCAINDRQCFEDGLRYCLQNSERLRKMKIASRSKAAFFDIRHVADDYEKVFKKAVGG